MTSSSTMVAAGLWRPHNGIILPSRVIDVPTILVTERPHTNARTRRAGRRTMFRRWRNLERIPLTRPSRIFQKPLSRLV